MVSADGLVFRQPCVFATNAITSTSGLAHVPQRSVQFYRRADKPLIATFDDSGNVIAADVALALNGLPARSPHDLPALDPTWRSRGALTTR
jgi:hypothetical protein